MMQTRAMDSARVYINNNNTMYSGPNDHSCPGTVHVPVTLQVYTDFNEHLHSHEHIKSYEYITCNCNAWHS